MGARAIVTSWWKAAFLLSLVLSVTDLATRWYTHRPWSRVFRPAVFFFVGPKVRPADLAVVRKGPVRCGAYVRALAVQFFFVLFFRFISWLECSAVRRGDGVCRAFVQLAVQ